MQLLINWLMMFYETYPYLFWPIALLVCLSLIYGSYVILRRNFWIMRFYMWFPFIGGIAKASRMTFHDSKWFDGERWLCRKFYDFYHTYDKDEYIYAKSKNYLGKIDELDRKPITFGISLLLFALLIFEGFTFAYILAGYIVLDASEFVQTLAGAGIAFVLSVILMLLTHMMGSQMYENFVKSRIL